MVFRVTEEEGYPSDEEGTKRVEEVYEVDEDLKEDLFVVNNFSNLNRGR